MNYSDITLVVGVDAKHLKELKLVWPSWIQHKPELKKMPCIMFFDAQQVDPGEMNCFMDHPSVRLIPWEMTNAESQREKMLTGFVLVPAREVRTPWYLKIDTDVIATKQGEWIKDEWFLPDEKGRLPVFISSPWGYTKPKHLMTLLDDWADRVPELAKKPRLNLPFGVQNSVLSHNRIISWLFFGRTDWTRKIASLLGPEGRLPYPSQDSFMFYCAKRLRCHYVRERMKAYGWDHRRVRHLRKQMATLKQEVCGSLDDRHGVVYYNMGTSCAVRLLVSLVSLREHYFGPVTILSEGEESHVLCERISQALGVGFIKWESGIKPGRHAPFLSKTRIHLGTPYEITVLIDSDTLVVGPIDELFTMAEKHTFCVAQFAGRTTKGRILRKRIQRWEEIMPEDLQPALEFGPAINTGVMAFTKNAPIFNEWCEVAEKGRDHFIPDEVSCQMMLHRYPHYILDSGWNRSCKHDNPDLPGTKIIHYHGRKHCRVGLPYYGDKWMAAFREVFAKNLADIRSWMPSGDRMLQKYLRAFPMTIECNHGSGDFGQASSGDLKLRIVLGAGRTEYQGWQSTQRKDLDITQEADFKRLLSGGYADRFLAEHVWEHLPDEAVQAANALTFKYLKPGGLLRIAVPDGLHPDPEYLERVRPNGSGRSANDHKQLFTHVTLTASLEAAGFIVEKLEHWDETGRFHSKPWSSEDGHIKRSARHDRRNRDKELSYTSLIIDALKPFRS